LYALKTAGSGFGSRAREMDFVSDRPVREEVSGDDDDGHLRQGWEKESL